MIEIGENEEIPFGSSHNSGLLGHTFCLRDKRGIASIYCKWINPDILVTWFRPGTFPNELGEIPEEARCIVKLGDLIDAYEEKLSNMCG